MKSSRAIAFARPTRHRVIRYFCVLSVTVIAANQYSFERDGAPAKHLTKRDDLVHSDYVSKEVRILKSEVIDNIECRLTAGYGAARNLGVIQIPRSEAMDFSVLSSSGARWGGSLPFHPTWTRIGKGIDGSIVVGFGELRGGGGEFRPPDSPEPVRIVRDNQTIFESEKVWDFDVAADGSSFIVHEPGPNGTSRLIVRNLTTDKEVRYDLGTRFTPVNAYESDYMLQYSIDFSEAEFTPAYADAWGRGNHWFFPIHVGERRRINVNDVESALFATSKEGYFVKRYRETKQKQARRLWKIYRTERDPTTDENRVIWQRTIELENFNGSMVLSRNGRWLGIRAWEYVVLSTQTGETQFHFRFVGDKKAQFERLRPVLPDNSTVSEIGSVGHALFIDDYLLISRKRGNAAACSRDRVVPYNRTTYRECLREQRRQNKYRNFYDVFDLNEVSGSPIFRTEVFRDTECTTANSPQPGLRVTNGVLTYGEAN